MEVARGVGNVAAVTSDIYVIAEEAATNGLVGMLGEWATTTTGLAQTEAWRALHNLQEAFFVADGMERVRYTDGLLPLRAPNAKWERERRGCEGGCDVVFVHGVWGKPLGTWCGGNGVWPRDMLTREIEGRVMTFQHDAGAVRIGEPSLAERAKKLQQALAKAQVGRRAVVFVTHSYGGILVKEAVVGRKEAFKGLKGVIFFATPHFGAPVARVPALLSRALHALCEERELQMLNDGFLQTVRQQGVEVVSFAEGIGVGGRGGALVVPVASADPGVGSFFIVPDVDHSAVCKVNEADDWRYRLVLDVIRRAELGPPTDP